MPLNCHFRHIILTVFILLQSHKKVSRRKTGDFNRWHSTWLAENVSESAHSSVADWFMGKTDGLVPNKTHKVVKNDHDKTPYRTYHKFRADIIKQQ